MKTMWMKCGFVLLLLSLLFGSVTCTFFDRSDPTSPITDSIKRPGNMGNFLATSGNPNEPNRLFVGKDVFAVNVATEGLYVCVYETKLGQFAAVFETSDAALAYFGLQADDTLLSILIMPLHKGSANHPATATIVLDQPRVVLLGQSHIVPPFTFVMAAPCQLNVECIYETLQGVRISTPDYVWPGGGTEGTMGTFLQAHGVAKATVVTAIEDQISKGHINSVNGGLLLARPQSLAYAYTQLQCNGGGPYPTATPFDPQRDEDPTPTPAPGGGGNGP